MSADPFRHRLIHVLLREQLGGETPPNLTDRILDRATSDTDADTDAIVELQHTRPIRFPVSLRWAMPAAAAAVALLALGIWMAARPRYPAPKASGDFHVVTGDSVRRGATIRSGSSPAVLELGGYCRIDLRPRTTLRIDGGPHAEGIFLEAGTAVCSVDSDVGKFGVLTELGTVRVSGTEFTVRIAQRERRKSMWVKVTAGAVAIDNGSKSEILLAGRERTIFADGPKPPEIVRRDKPSDKPTKTTEGPGDSTGRPDQKDPGYKDDFSSSADDTSGLRAEIRALLQQTREIDELIRKTREENARLRRRFEAGRTPQTQPGKPKPQKDKQGERP